MEEHYLMRSALLIAGAVCISLSVPRVRAAEDLKSDFQALKSELNDKKPTNTSSDTEKAAYIVLFKTRCGDFAKKYPKTVEGFGAAMNAAQFLTRIGDPEAGSYAELACGSAPAEGVDPKAVAVCWAWLAQARLKGEDFDGMQAAVEHIKPLDPEMYETVVGQVRGYLKRLEAQKLANERLKPGNLPFAIEEKDVDGKPFSLASWKGKVAIVEFWAMHCPICMREMPKMVKLYEKYHDKGLEVVGVNLDDDESKLRDTIKTHSIAWTQLFPFGSHSEIATQWGIMPIPKVVVVDRKGVIRNVDVLGDELAAVVDRLIAEQ